MGVGDRDLEGLLPEVLHLELPKSSDKFGQIVTNQLALAPTDQRWEVTGKCMKTLPSSPEGRVHSSWLGLDHLPKMCHCYKFNCGTSPRQALLCSGKDASKTPVVALLRKFSFSLRLFIFKPRDIKDP